MEDCFTDYENDNYYTTPTGEVLEIPKEVKEQIKKYKSEDTSEFVFGV